MACWDGSFNQPVEKWRWQKMRVWSPFIRCERNGKRLFLKTAYYGIQIVDWEFNKDMWLSSSEYMLAVLKEEFET